MFTIDGATPAVVEAFYLAYYTLGEAAEVDGDTLYNMLWTHGRKNWDTLTLAFIIAAMIDGWLSALNWVCRDGNILYVQGVQDKVALDLMIGSRDFFLKVRIDPSYFL